MFLCLFVKYNIATHTVQSMRLSPVWSAFCLAMSSRGKLVSAPRRGLICGVVEGCRVQGLWQGHGQATLETKSNVTRHPLFTCCSPRASDSSVYERHVLYGIPMATLATYVFRW